MKHTFGNIYEMKFEENGPRPFGCVEKRPVRISVDIPGPVRISGVNIPDAISRWSTSRESGYVPYYPPISSVIKILDGVYY